MKKRSQIKFGLWDALAIVVLVGIFFGLSIHRSTLEQKRSTALIDAASSIGLTYHGQISREELSQTLLHPSLFTRTYKECERVRNIASGTYKGQELMLFDCYDYIGGGKQRTELRFSVTAFKTQKPIPTFISIREGVIHSNDSNDIDFENHKIYSDFYYLSGAKEEAVRNTLPDKFISALESSNEFWHIESTGHWVLIYNNAPEGDIRIQPELLEPALQERLSFYLMLND